MLALYSPVLFRSISVFRVRHTDPSAWLLSFISSLCVKLAGTVNRKFIEQLPLMCDHYYNTPALLYIAPGLTVCVCALRLNCKDEGSQTTSRVANSHCDPTDAIQGGVPHTFLFDLLELFPVCQFLERKLKKLFLRNEKKKRWKRIVRAAFTKVSMPTPASLFL